MTKLYHVTKPKDYLGGGIQTEGLKCDEEGYIYLLTDRKAAAFVAFEQLFLEDYALLEISTKGIRAELEDDNVAELTAKYQRRVKQNLIKPQYINFINCYTISNEFKEMLRQFGRGRTLE